MLNECDSSVTHKVENDVFPANIGKHISVTLKFLNIISFMYKFLSHPYFKRFV